MKKCFLLLCILCCTLFVHAQGELEIDSLAPYQDTIGWYDFPEDSNVSFSYVQEHLHDLLLLGPDDSLAQVMCETDTMYFTHCKYQQYHKGYEVDGATIALHAIGNSLLTMNGLWFNDLSISNSGLANEDDALDAALAHVDASLYAWQDTAWENEIKEDFSDTSATYYPTGRLVIEKTDDTGAFVGANFVLCYEFEIVSISPFSHKLVFVNAQSGEYQNERNELRSCNPSSGTCVTLNDGSRSFQTSYRSFPYYDYILEDCRGDNGKEGILTRWGFEKKWNHCSKITNNGNSWSAVDDRTGTTSHWAVQQAWDYFKYVHGRDGTTNGKRETRVFVSVDTSEKNTYYDWVRKKINQKEFNHIYVGHHINNVHMASLDALGHEYNHGVIHATANLYDKAEWGSLGESWGDIFGTAVERFVRGSGFDWMEGGDYGGSRKMNDPLTSPNWVQPDTYKGLNWIPLDSAWDDYGVHINDGVPNKWFYLLAHGDTHQTSKIYVPGIGFDPAIKIAYRAMVYYLQPYSRFHDARKATIYAARDLYGRCSDYTQQCQLAWNAVAVNGMALSSGFCCKIYGLRQLCIGKGYLFSADFFPGATYTWTVPNGWTQYQYSNLLYVVPTSGSTATLSVSISWNSQTTSSSKSLWLTSCSMQHPSGFINPHKDITGCMLYPNPATKKISLELTGPKSDLQAGASDYTLFDLTGKTLAQGHFSGRLLELDISTLPPGMYGIRVEHESSTIITRKFVVTK